MISTAQIRDERGTTLIELMVSLTVGLVVLSALTMVMVTALHGSARVSARVHANQSARLAMTAVMQDLHSACMSPEIAPVQENSTGTSLQFIHQTGSAVAPVPTLSIITLSEGKLTQSEYGPPTGTAPAWVWPKKAFATRQLATNISPTPPATWIFSYYAYSKGVLSETPLPTPLKSPNPALTVAVHIAFTAAPGNTPVTDPNAATEIQNTATFRLTPPSFNEGSPARPCQ